MYAATKEHASIMNSIKQQIGFYRIKMGVLFFLKKREVETTRKKTELLYYRFRSIKK
jgi:hypothetical protein